MSAVNARQIGPGFRASVAALDAFDPMYSLNQAARARMTANAAGPRAANPLTLGNNK